MERAKSKKEISFWAFLWLCIKEAWKTSWEKSDTGTGIAGAGVAVVAHFFPRWEQAMTNVAWEIPLVALASIIIVRLLKSPFMLYRKRDIETESLKEELKRLQERKDRDWNGDWLLLEKRFRMINSSIYAFWQQNGLGFGSWRAVAYWRRRY